MCWEETWMCIWIRSRRLCGHAMRCDSNRTEMLDPLFTVVSTTRWGELLASQTTPNERVRVLHSGFPISRAVKGRSDRPCLDSNADRDGHSTFMQVTML